MATGMYEIFLQVLKNAARCERVKYFSILEEKFCMSEKPCNILFII